MLDKPAGIVFFVALSDYDVPVFDGSKMKLEDSMDVFEEVPPTLDRCPVVV
jgi:hypothetical protein